MSSLSAIEGSVEFPVTITTLLLPWTAGRVLIIPDRLGTYHRLSGRRPTMSSRSWSSGTSGWGSAAGLPAETSERREEERQHPAVGRAGP